MRRLRLAGGLCEARDICVADRGVLRPPEYMQPVANAHILDVAEKSVKPLQGVDGIGVIVEAAIAGEAGFLRAVQNGFGEQSRAFAIEHLRAGVFLEERLDL